LKRWQDVKIRKIEKQGNLNSRLKSVMSRTAARPERKNSEKAKNREIALFLESRHEYSRIITT